jgi:hypothetical protein
MKQAVCRRNTELVNESHSGESTGLTYWLANCLPPPRESFWSPVRCEVFTVVTMKNAVAFERTDISEERIASIIRVTRINEIGTVLAVTSN